MRLRFDRKWIGIVSLIVVAVVIASVSGAYALEKADVDRSSVIFENVVITSVDNSTITVVGGSGEVLELFARGGWIVISDRVERLPWNETMNYVGADEAVIARATVTRGNFTGSVLLGLRQGDLLLLRPIFLKHCVKAHRHTSTYMSFRATLADKGENYMTLEREGHKVIALTKGEWIKAGGATVTWGDVSDEFMPGDEIRLFYHNIVVMNDEFEENFGIKGFIWGYSGAIIDLTTGITLSRK